MKSSTRKTRAGVALLAIPLLMTAACGSSSTEDSTAEGDTPVVKMDGVVPDPFGVVPVFVKEEGLDKKYGFTLEYTEGDPAGGTTPFLQGRVQLGPGDAVSAAIANGEGHDTVAYYPLMSQTASVIASGASGIKSPEDLRGRRIGHFGNDSGTTQAITLTLKDGWNIDVQKDMSLVQSSPEALPALLANGEVDAIFDFEPFGDRAVQMASGKRILEVTKYWQDKEGWAPPLAMLWSNRSWLTENPELANNVVAAYSEAMQTMIDANYETFKQEPYKSFLDAESDAELDRLVTYCQNLPCYTNEWTEQDATAMNDWVKLMVDNGMLPSYPQNPPSATLDSVLAK
ncbi:ABC transporter substrate-binding protein [Mycolicibacterium sp. jd]|uniref:ABC transporter substrate-binding protein n=1 Tax=unclassified Mycolicibacterium TaxID=2636767 RepID=UPI00351ABCD2